LRAGALRAALRVPGRDFIAVRRAVFFDAFAARDFAGFVAGAVAEFPRAEMIYLEYRLVLFAADHGVDLIDAFHVAGKRVDAYTLTTTDAAAVAIARRLLDLRADQITTDDSVGLEQALAGVP
jgi:glycerophosphoryl diester phosphodiesterase